MNISQQDRFQGISRLHIRVHVVDEVVVFDLIRFVFEDSVDFLVQVDLGDHWTGAISHPLVADSVTREEILKGLDELRLHLTDDALAMSLLDWDLLSEVTDFNRNRMSESDESLTANDRTDGVDTSAAGKALDNAALTYSFRGC